MNKQESLQGVFSKAQRMVFNSYSKSVFGQLSTCRTLSNGYHLSQCSDCGHQQMQFHGCGNRHCLFCGHFGREQWVGQRRAELLPTTYYHVVFTLPHELNGLVMGNRTLLYNLLLESSSQTLIQFGKDPKYLGAEIGITSVLHTWGQNLSFHPHVHCIVSGGGFDGNQWQNSKRVSGKFLFPVGAMKIVFKGILMKGLRKLRPKLRLDKLNFEDLLSQIGQKAWNVYAKRPFGGAMGVLEYLGRYTHRIAISSSRITEVGQTTVSFNYKDYADGSKVKQMTLSHEEFLRRFEQHILPRYFVKIRHYGYLRNRGKQERLKQILASLQLSERKPIPKLTVEQFMQEKYGTGLGKCPCCGEGRMVSIAVTYSHRCEPIQASFQVRNKASPV
ncbi:transposase [Emticicia oligotrophica DSM 17448]|uniref:Transposase n=1 Tax=Emticicia oligotrophica (strain DSM 17448 / CIP 109782 / MTCC 6937 / GPTSA100-15) TaxID=929562 RepID=A0ABM5N4W7_EMTOG|nr:IS91 family transposase [Emticicia oligotrophica]AFK04519.1 transposase [Emticicia oligotrophica DSM 17448]AFK04526.1 transposase [Emticicia oligotrophica DSM 17448]